MRKWEVAWAILLGGLPFSPFLFRPHLDIWHAQTLWVHIGIISLLGLWLWDGAAKLSPAKPLAAWAAWTGLTVLMAWTQLMIKSKLYPLPMAMGLLHVLGIILLITIATSTWTPATISMLSKVIAISGVIVLGYCLLQLGNMDEFFASKDESVRTDALVGTIGNPTHLAAYLSMLLPVLWSQPGKRWWAAGSLCLLILLLCKSTTGLVAAMASTLIVLYFQDQRLWKITLLISIFGFIFLLLNRADILNAHGRWEAWQAFWAYFENKPITGNGLGFVMAASGAIKEGSPIFQWRHVHNELFQLAIEQGIIGLGIILWGLWDCVKRIPRAVGTREGLMCVGVFAAFSITCLFNFSAHLWLLGSLGLFGYCGVIALTKEADVSSHA